MPTTARDDRVAVLVVVFVDVGGARYSGRRTTAPTPFSSSSSTWLSTSLAKRREKRTHLRPRSSSKLVVVSAPTA